MGSTARMGLFLIGILFAIIFGTIAIISAFIYLMGIIGIFATSTIFGGAGLVLILMSIYLPGD